MHMFVQQIHDGGSNKHADEGTVNACTKAIYIYTKFTMCYCIIFLPYSIYFGLVIYLTMKQLKTLKLGIKQCINKFTEEKFE